jgi:uncharacterized repeat protein (TIGR01451 family)
VTGEPVLSMVKSVSAKSVSPGEEFSYTITYQNTGTKASDALRIEDPLPDYVTFVSATQGGAPDTQQPATSSGIIYRLWRPALPIRCKWW